MARDVINVASLSLEVIMARATVLMIAIKSTGCPPLRSTVNCTEKKYLKILRYYLTIKH